jgi:hypothetical protein
MRPIYSYIRLVLFSWLFLGGLAILFGPTAASVEREARWRERQLRTVPADERPQWLEDRDKEDAQSQAYVRLFGVVIGGIGLAALVREAALLGSRDGRRLPPGSA